MISTSSSADARPSSGDTAQVGSQIAEKLGIPQITYAEDIISADNCEVVVKRRIESGVETVKAKLPLVVTVNGSAAECRPRNAKALQKYKYAGSAFRTHRRGKKAFVEKRHYLAIGEWSASDVDADLAQCGLAGFTPTKVKSIENVVFTAKEARRIENNDEEARMPHQGAHSKPHYRLIDSINNENI